MGTFDRFVAPKKIIQEMGDIGLGGEQLPLKLEVETFSNGSFEIRDQNKKFSILGGIDSKTGTAGISHLFLSEELRGQGNGARILDSVEKYLEGIGVKRIYMAFQKQTTISFLMKQGYKIVNPEQLERELYLAIGFIGIQLERGINEQSFESWKRGDVEFNTGGKILLKKDIASQV